MRSITVAQAALLAALASAILAAYYLADNTELLRSESALFLSGSVVPSLVWAGFFIAAWRRRPVPKIAAWIAFGAVLLESAAVILRFQYAVNYWTPFGNALSLTGWLLRLGWGAFLAALIRAPDGTSARRIALGLAILSAPSAIGTAYQAWNNWLGLLIDDLPRQSLWRVAITPAIRTLFWISQILFLWTAWDQGVSAVPLKPSPSRLTL